MIWIAAIFLVVSSVFLLRSSYEMFVLTPQYGPQMIFFSLTHTWSYPAVMVFFYSWYTYYLLIGFAVLFAASRLVLDTRRVRLWSAG